MPQRTGTDVAGSNVTAPDRVPAVDLRDPQYILQDAANQPDPDPAPADPEPVLPPAQNVPSFTAEQIEKARREEREKVLKRLENEKTRAAEYAKELEELRAYREAAEAETARQQKLEERRLKKEAEKDLDAKEILARREEEWDKRQADDRKALEDQMAQLRAERDQERAQLALERETLQLQNYITTRVNEELNAKTIAPQFVRFISASTREAVDQQIEDAIAATTEILNEVAGQQSAAPPRATGVSTNTGPSSVGSMTEMNSEPIDYTKLTLKEYVEKVRPQLQIEKRDNGIFS